MVEAWWLVVAACGGVMVGMFLFALMSMAREEPQSDFVAPRITNALN
jgi:hypothetical protein